MYFYAYSFRSKLGAHFSSRGGSVLVELSSSEKQGDGFSLVASHFLKDVVTPGTSGSLSVLVPAHKSRVVLVTGTVYVVAVFIYVTPGRALADNLKFLF